MSVSFANLRQPAARVLIRWAAIVLVFMLILGFLLPYVSSLSRLEEDIDINSGRIRRTRHILFSKKSETIEDTWVSQAIGQPEMSPVWSRVNTFRLGKANSPHYAYHSAIHQLRSVEQIATLIPFSPEAKKDFARGILRCWGQGSDDTADAYIHAVLTRALRKYEENALQVELADLEAIQTEMEHGLR